MLVNVTHEEFGLLLMEDLTAALDRNKFIEGPLELIATADVYPGDMSPPSSPSIVESGVVPDVTVVLKGKFRTAPDPSEPYYDYQLRICDRADGCYFSSLSNNLEDLLTLLPTNQD